MRGLAREAFEAAVAPSVLIRNGEGYLDTGINHDWEIWQLAWLAAHHYQSASPKGCLSIHELTEEELCFINSILR